MHDTEIKRQVWELFSTGERLEAIEAKLGIRIQLTRYVNLAEDLYDGRYYIIRLGSEGVAANAPCGRGEP